MLHIWGGGAPATWGVPSTEGGLNSQRETNDKGQWEMEEDTTTEKIATAWTSTCFVGAQFFFKAKIRFLRDCTYNVLLKAGNF